MFIVNRLEPLRVIDGKVILTIILVKGGFP